MKITYVLVKPVLTEKSLKLQQQDKYVFEVTKSSKTETVSKELKSLYGVDVIHVNSLILPGKKRRLGKTPRFMKTAKRKRVIVQLKKGQKLDLFPKAEK